MSKAVKSILFSPITIRGVTLRNRICVSPMCQYSADEGLVNDWHLVNAGSFATGGAGMVMIEATGVEARGRISPGCPGLWTDTQIEPMARISRFLKSQGAVPGIQLAHGGRKASTLPPFVGHDSIGDDKGGWPTIGPSAIAFGGPIGKVPKEATIDDIEEIKEAWVRAAQRAVTAGFEVGHILVIELHFAHGYLVSTFLSPATNKRTDKYGGSLENRMRFGLEIARNIRHTLPDNIALGVRVSVTDYADQGWDVPQTIEFARELKALGIDFLDCSSGGVVGGVDYNPLNTNKIQIEIAGTIQREVGLATAAVGKIVDPHVAEAILQGNGATLIFMGRAFLNNPHWPYIAADQLTDEQAFKYPPQYDWCIGWKGMAKWRKAVLLAEK
ncbi:unnamed protein product [Oppiella nova]|uniref:NADH:flavin oxidoreductase/NADH oxidase N-terminal domain-containing protein n=1 Tax=Oppiella nova TaxID=334625 RepID=A0A7R9MI02_9ACAR|nr:unnamed protein product [Oppiella nova]CAG2177311.1 unnamed protein product [Oppiella nova]